MAISKNIIDIHILCTFNRYTANQKPISYALIKDTKRNTCKTVTIRYMRIQGGTAIRGGQRFANFYCTSFKTNICVDTEGAL